MIIVRYYNTSIEEFYCIIGIFINLGACNFVSPDLFFISTLLLIFMVKSVCRACGAELIPGKEFCPKCLVRVPEKESLKKVLLDTPENRSKNFKEYKVIGQEDKFLNGGRFDKTSLEKMLNSYAEEGWMVKEISTSKTFGIFFGTPRDEMIIILERNKWFET